MIGRIDTVPHQAELAKAFAGRIVHTQVWQRDIGHGARLDRLRLVPIDGGLDPVFLGPHKLAAVLDEHLAFGFFVIAQAIVVERAAQRRVFTVKPVRAQVDHRAGGGAPRTGPAAGLVHGFDNQAGQSTRLQIQRRPQPGHAGADNQYIRQVTLLARNNTVPGPVIKGQCGTEGSQSLNLQAF